MAKKSALIETPVVEPKATPVQSTSVEPKKTPVVNTVSDGHASRDFRPIKK